MTTELPQIQKFNGDNFHLWKFQMKIILEAKDLLSITDGSEIVNCQTSAEMWKKLSTIYELKSETNKYLLQQRFFEYKMNPNDNIATHISKVETLAQQMKDLGEPISDVALITKIICSLPDKYKNFITAWDLVSSEEKTLENLTARLLKEESLQDHWDSSGNSKPDNALMTFSKFNRNSTASNKQQQHQQSIKDKKKNTHCGYCKKKGHWWKECYKRKEEQKGQQPSSSSRDDSCAFSAETSAFLAETKDSWIADSGATDHMTFRREWFSTFEEIPEGVHPVCLGDGKKIYAKGKGNIDILSYVDSQKINATLLDVLYVPELETNLFSISTATKHGLTLICKGNQIKLTKNSKVLVTGIKDNSNLYRIFIKAKQSSQTHVAQLSLDIWHQRMGHVNPIKLTQMFENNVFEDDIKIREKPDSLLCEACIYGKQNRKVFHASTSPNSTYPGELIYSDVCGPMSKRSPGGSLYFVSFKDDFSRFRVAYFIRHKSDVLEKFKEFVKRVRTETGNKIKRFRTDNGTEFLNKNFSDYLKSLGIVHELTAPYTPEQNGIAERDNRTIVESARCLLHGRKMPLELWAEAVNTAVYLLNRCTTKVLGNSTPYEIWYKRKPSILHLKTFGCNAYVHIPKDNRKKLDKKSIRTFFVGYTETNKNYRMWDPIARKIIISRDVIFTEANTSENIQDNQQEQVTIYSEESVDNTNTSSKPEESCRYPLRNRIRENEQTSTSCTRAISYACYVHDQEPLNYEDAIVGQNSKQWKLAMDDEFNSLMKNQTWTYVTLPSDRKAIACKWVYKIKQNADGSNKMFKARLVAKGYSQKPGLDYGETFSPVVKFDSIRTILSLCASLDMEMIQLDVKSAFLNGDLEEELYMEQPQGYENPDFPNHVCSLQKSIYGLKQSPRMWNKKFHEFLIKFDLKPSISDSCVYTMKCKQAYILLAIYVDDCLICSVNKQHLDDIVQYLNSNFEIKTFTADYFLGLQIYRDRTTKMLFLHQTSYIERTREHYNLLDIKLQSVPSDPYSKLTKEMCPKDDQEIEEMNKIPYRQTIGSLMYLMTGTRPDIAYAVSRVSQFMNNPGPSHWTAVKKIFGYLKATKNIGICFGGSPCTSTLIGFSDADFAGDLDTRKSTTGYVFMLNNGPISWCSQKQNCVSLSTTESEYIAASKATKEAIWLRHLLRELHQEQVKPTTIFCDNQSCIRLVHNPEYHKRTKHIDISYHFIRDHFQNHAIDLLYVCSNDQAADIFTKALPPERYRRLRSQLGLFETTKCSSGGSVEKYDPETKRQSSQWLEPGEPRFKKARMIKSKLKCLRLVHYEFVPEAVPYLVCDCTCKVNAVAPQLNSLGCPQFNATRLDFFLHISKRKHNIIKRERIRSKLQPQVLRGILVGCAFCVDMKEHRKGTCKNMVEMFKSEPHWLKNVITGDETWVYRYDPETKRQSSQWLEPGEPRFKKARMIKSKLKCLRLVHYEFVPEAAAMMFLPNQGVTNLPIPEFMKNFMVDGKPLFPLANDENKFLGEEVLRKERELAELKVKYEEQQQVNKYCEDHCKAIESELLYLQNVRCSRQNELETAENLQKVLNRELDWIKQQDQLTLKRIEESKSRQQNLQDPGGCMCLIFMADAPEGTQETKELDQKTLEIEKLKSNINVNHETLDVWLAEAAQKEEENMVLIKYRQQNEFKLKELNKQLELTTAEATRWKKLADEAFNDVVSLQRELQLAADDFRNIHKEREAIVAQLETALHHMMKKDADITDKMTKIEQLQQEEARLNEELAEATTFYEKLQADNEGLENNCKMLEKEGCLLRTKIVELERNVKDLDSEVLTKRMNLNSLELQISNDRNQLNNMEKDLEKKGHSLTVMEEKNEKLKQELDKIRTEVLSEEEALKRLEKIQDEKEKYQELLNQKITDIQKTKLQVLNNNIDLKNKEKTLKYEIEVIHSQPGVQMPLNLCSWIRSPYRSVKVALKNLGVKMATAEAQKIQQENQMYKMEYEILRLEQRIRILYGNKAQDETEVYEKEIESLKKKLEEKEAYAETLSNEVKENEHHILNVLPSLGMTIQIPIKQVAAQKELHRVVKKMEELKVEKEHLNHKVDEAQLHITHCYRDLKELTKQKEDLMVEESLIKVRLGRLESLLDQKANSVVSLQRQQLDFQNGLQEQLKEIHNRTEMFNMEIKLAEQERATLAANIANYNSKIDTIRIRIRVIINTIGIEEEGGEESPDVAIQVLIRVSATDVTSTGIYSRLGHIFQTELLNPKFWFISKVEREKDHLSKEIQDTKRQVCQAKKDKDSLQNSIFLIEATLEIYKLMLHPVSLQDQYSLNLLEEEACQLSSQLQELQEECAVLGQETQQLQQEVEVEERRVEQLVDIQKEHQAALNALVADLQEQAVKLARADSLNSRLVAELRDNPNFPLLEKDMKLKLLRELNRRVTSLIEECANKYPYISSRVNDLFYQHHLPAIQISRTSSTSTTSGTLSTSTSSSLSRRPAPVSHLWCPPGGPVPMWSLLTSPPSMMVPLLPVCQNNGLTMRPIIVLHLPDYLYVCQNNGLTMRPIMVPHLPDYLCVPEQWSNNVAHHAAAMMFLPNQGVTNLPIPEFMKNFMVDGKPLFPLANDENKFLGEEVLRKERELAELKVKYEEQQQVNKYCEDHCKAIESELLYLQNVRCSRQNELETAENLQKVLNRELDWIKQQDQLTLKRIEESKSRQQNLQKELDQKTLEIEKLKSNINVNHETLDVWLAEAAQKEEENMVLIKYRQQNEFKLKELNKQLELTTAEATRWKKLADEAFNDVVSLQRELQLAADDFRNIHKEREAIVAQLETALHHMMKKDADITDKMTVGDADITDKMTVGDADITDKMTKIEQLQQEEARLNEELAEATTFYEKLQADNEGLENNCKMLEKEGCLLRTKIVELERNVKDLDSEVLTKRMNLNSLELQISNDRNQLNNMEKDLEKKGHSLTVMEEKNEKLKQELDKIRTEVLSEEEALKRLEKIQDEKEKYQELLNQKITDIQKTKLQVLNNNIDLKNKEKTLKYEIESVKVALKNLGVKMATAEAQKIQQENQMYKMEYEILRLEQRIRILYGNKAQDETEVYEKEIESLKKKLEEKEAYAETLSNEVKENEHHILNVLPSLGMTIQIPIKQVAAQKELHRVVKKMEELKVEKEHLNHKVDEAQLHITHCYRDLKELTKQKEDLMVEESLIKVRLGRLESLLDQKANSVVSLQRQQLDFQNGLQEQLKEIHNRTEMFNMEIKLAEQERATLAANIANYNSKIDTIRIRIRVIINTIGIEEEGGEESPDVAIQVLIRVEREKDHLSKEIQDTKRQVCQAKKDKDSLQNSIFLIEATLEIYKLMLHPVSLQDQYSLNLLEEEACQLSSQLQELQEECAVLGQETQQLQQEVEVEERRVEQLVDIQKEHQAALNALVADLQEQAVKLARADSLNSRLVAELRDNPNFPLLEKDMKLKLLRELNRRVTSLIEECANKYPYISSRVNDLFYQHHLPAIQISRTSSTSTTSGTLSTSTSSSLSRRPSSSLPPVVPSRRPSPNVVSIDFSTLHDGTTPSCVPEQCSNNEAYHGTTPS
ncbi:hypothetical protein LAZ67_2001397 [Cordylochernes scorpioides]|uniref:Coiled-coil domain-containing protein 39 n=1 Tax=Cordylochernes scorpioides TaxID=51811 RepID=A0ABY6K4D6_9ARAC|nr:hypothetical protein LAZ67_2001397 [Cordylochernes scorpioides]